MSRVLFVVGVVGMVVCEALAVVGGMTNVLPRVGVASVDKPSLKTTELHTNLCCHECSELNPC